MAVAVRSSSIRSSADALSSSVSIPVPSGASASDVVVCSVGQWLGSGGEHAITPPTGFEEVDTVLVNLTKVAVYRMRLSTDADDSGSYTFTWPDAQWSNGSAVCFSGVVTSGEPVSAVDSAGVFDSSQYPDLAVDVAAGSGLAWTAYNESATDSTVPTDYTEIASQQYGTTAHRVTASTGTTSATGATVGSVMDLSTVLLAVAPEPDDPDTEPRDITLSATLRSGWIVSPPVRAPLTVRDPARGDWDAGPPIVEE